MQPLDLLPASVLRAGQEEVYRYGGRSSAAFGSGRFAFRYIECSRVETIQWRVQRVYYCRLRCLGFGSGLDVYGTTDNVACPYHWLSGPSRCI